MSSIQTKRTQPKSAKSEQPLKQVVVAEKVIVVAEPVVMFQPTDHPKGNAVSEVDAGAKHNKQRNYKKKPNNNQFGSNAGDTKLNKVDVQAVENKSQIAETPSNVAVLTQKGHKHRKNNMNGAVKPDNVDGQVVESKAHVVTAQAKSSDLTNVHGNQQSIKQQHVKQNKNQRQGQNNKKPNVPPSLSSLETLPLTETLGKVEKEVPLNKKTTNQAKNTNKKKPSSTQKQQPNHKNSPTTITKQAHPVEENDTERDNHFSNMVKAAFPDGTFEYVDTHVHIDSILGRLNRMVYSHNKRVDNMNNANNNDGKQSSRDNTSGNVASIVGDASINSTTTANPTSNSPSVVQNNNDIDPATTASSTPVVTTEQDPELTPLKSCCGEPEPTTMAVAVLTKENETKKENNTQSNESAPLVQSNILKKQQKQEPWTLSTLHNCAHVGNFGGAITVCCEPESYNDVLDILNNDKSGKIYGAFGVHPHVAKQWSPTIQKKFETAMGHPKVVAWGECGLDYYHSHSPHDVQKACFIEQIKLAVKYNKVLMVHTRDAEEDTLEIMLKHVPKDHLIHIHCCKSSIKMVKPMLEYFTNIYFGFTGCITFPKVEPTIIESLSIVPLNRLLCETDGPYMAPVPFRGAVAHSGMIPFIAATMAKVKKVELNELMKIVRENTKTIYGF